MITKTDERIGRIRADLMDLEHRVRTQEEKSDTLILDNRRLWDVLEAYTDGNVEGSIPERLDQLEEELTDLSERLDEYWELDEALLRESRELNRHLEHLEKGREKPAEPPKKPKPKFRMGPAVFVDIVDGFHTARGMKKFMEEDDPYLPIIGGKKETGEPGGDDYD